jgi:carbonic anhydrase
MEVHLVHRNRITGALSVLGVLMEPGGAPNQALATALKYAPLKAREEVESPAPINPAALLPRGGSMAYVRYAGSLTTPGCSEGVDWCAAREGRAPGRRTGPASPFPPPCPPLSRLPRLLPLRPSHTLTTTIPLPLPPPSRYVMLETAAVSPEQVLAFGQYVSGGRSFGQNARPLQPLNGRAFDLQYDCTFPSS